MSYLRKQKTACGRYVKKPNETDDAVNYEDDTSIPLQDQIDNLRAKISLKEKYNKALREEVSETNAGAASMITELTQQTKQLREDLEQEKNAEKSAVRKALRSYRLFQLAVNEKSAESVINWLDDKIFDASKALNEGVYKLKSMQNKIQDAEGQVQHLEHCPVPGSEEWERRAEDDRINLECAIENRKANRDAVSILNRKYREILFMLRGEKGKWPHVMQSMERTLNLLKNELSSLETMLEDANRFREDAREKLKLTEEEASANRKQRRTQMNKMKKSVERALEANTAKYLKGGPEVTIKGRAPPSSSTQTLPVDSNYIVMQNIKNKQALVQEYENTVDRLVQAMRVRDLRQCPKRLSTVRKVGEVLTNEMAMKEELRDLLIKHKYRMQLILHYLRYTGSKKQAEFKEQIAEKERLLEDTEISTRDKEAETNDDGIILSDLRFSMISLEELLQQGKKKPAPPSVKNEEMKYVIKRALEKIRQLVESVNSLKSNFQGRSKQQRSYAPFVKFHTSPRHIRVGGMDEVEDLDSDPELDIIDSNIPSRVELKQRSDRFYSQALLRRGVR